MEIVEGLWHAFFFSLWKKDRDKEKENYIP